MRIVSIQYNHTNYNDPIKWLERIDFYTGIFDELAKNFEFHSFYHINFKGTLTKNNVHYHFTGLRSHNLIFPFGFHRQIKKLDPDAIIVQGFRDPFQIWLLQKFLRKDVKFYIHHHADRPLRFHKKFFQSNIDRFIRGYFFVSRFQAEEWIRAGQIRDQKKIYEMMECSSVYQTMDRTLARQSTGTSGRVYLWVGRLDGNKDPLTLANAFVKFSIARPEASLYIIYQQNDLYHELTKIVSGYDHIILVGQQSKDQLVYWYNSADFIIATSHYEGSGIAVCEAMSCGCIPILTAIPSFKWMTNEACGLLFKPGDEIELLNALILSEKIDIEEERKKTLAVFQSRLSFKSISNQMQKIFQTRG